MKLVITLDAIKDAFKKIGTLYAKDGRGITDKNVKITVSSHTATFSAGGRFSGLKTIVQDVDSTEGGEIIVKFDLLNKIIANAKKNIERIDFNTNGNVVKVGVGSSAFSVPTCEDVSIIDLDITGAKRQYDLPADKFCLYADAVSRFADPAAGQVVFSGVYIKPDGENINVVATDTRCMGWGRIHHNNANQPGDGVIIQQNQIQAATDIFESCQSENGLITLYVIDDQKAIFADGKTFYAVGLLCGTYPRYETIFEKKGYFSVTYDTDEIQESLEQARIVTNNEYRGVMFTFTEDGRLTLDASSPEAGAAVVNLFNETTTAGRVKLDCNLILKAITAAGTDKVQLLIPDKNNNPVVINPEEHLKIAVMPLSQGR